MNLLPQAVIAKIEKRASNSMEQAGHAVDNDIYIISVGPPAKIEGPFASDADARRQAQGVYILLDESQISAGMWQVGGEPDVAGGDVAQRCGDAPDGKTYRDPGPEISGTDTQRAPESYQSLYETTEIEWNEPGSDLWVGRVVIRSLNGNMLPEKQPGRPFWVFSRTGDIVVEMCETLKIAIDRAKMPRALASTDSQPQDPAPRRRGEQPK